MTKMCTHPLTGEIVPRESLYGPEGDSQSGVSNEQFKELKSILLDIQNRLIDIETRLGGHKTVDNHVETTPNISEPVSDEDMEVLIAQMEESGDL